jgi:hypothetical protein
VGINVKSDADVRGYNGQRLRSDIVAVLEGEYDLGWSRNGDGSFDLIADLWGVAKKHNQTELINSINQKYALFSMSPRRSPSEGFDPRSPIVPAPVRPGDGAEALSSFLAGSVATRPPAVLRRPSACDGPA